MNDDTFVPRGRTVAAAHAVLGIVVADPRAVGAAAGRLAGEGRRPAGQRRAAARDAAPADRGARRRPAGDQRAPGRGRPLPPAVRDAPVGHRHVPPVSEVVFVAVAKGIGNCELLATDVRSGPLAPAAVASRTTRT